MKREVRKELQQQYKAVQTMEWVPRLPIVEGTTCAVVRLEPNCKEVALSPAAQTELEKFLPARAKKICVFGGCVGCWNDSLKTKNPVLRLYRKALGIEKKGA